MLNTSTQTVYVGDEAEQSWGASLSPPSCVFPHTDFKLLHLLQLAGVDSSFGGLVLSSNTNAMRREELEVLDMMSALKELTRCAKRALHHLPKSGCIPSASWTHRHVHVPSWVACDSC